MNKEKKELKSKYEKNEKKNRHYMTNWLIVCFNYCHTHTTNSSCDRIRLVYCVMPQNWIFNELMMMVMSWDNTMAH